MKKALLVLLLLAVAGGLFAQVLTTGEVYVSFQAVSAKPDWGLNWYGDGTAAFFAGSFSGGEGTYGGNFTVSAGSAFNNNLAFSTIRGWFMMFDKKLKIVGGRWSDGEFRETGLGGTRLWTNAKTGIAAIVYPTDEVRLGFGLHAAHTGLTSFDQLAYWFGAGYKASDLGVYAQADVAKNNIDASLNAFYNLDTIYFALDAKFTKLNDFDPNGAITLREYFDYSGVENFDFSIKFTEVFSGAPNSDVGFSVAFGAEYYPEIDFIPAVGLGLGYDIDGDGMIYINPYVLFGLDSSRYLLLDYEVDISFTKGADPEHILTLGFRWDF
jgi:hypothetical protein